MPAHEVHTSSQRSRSPVNRYHHVRSRSPHSRHHHPVSHKHKRSKPPALTHLPFQALKLHKHDFEALKPMFELYLDIQKQKVLEELPNDEIQGRWKSFIGKWYIPTLLMTIFPFFGCDCVDIHFFRACPRSVHFTRNKEWQYFKRILPIDTICSSAWHY